MIKLIITILNTSQVEFTFGKEVRRMEWLVLFLGIVIIVAIAYWFRKISDKRAEERLNRQAEEYNKRSKEKKDAIMENARIVQARQELKNQGAPVISDNYVEKYMNNEITLKTAENFANYFILKIKSLDRNVRITTLEYSAEFGAVLDNGEGGVCTKVAPLVTVTDLRHYDPFYVKVKGCDYLFNFLPREHCFIDFVSENLYPLRSLQEMNAFVRAVALNAVAIINQKYPLDSSGTDYQILMREYSGRGYDCNGISIKFEYIARNGNYTAPQEW